VYQELETAHSRQSSELGDLRKHNEVLSKSLDTMNKAQPAKETEQPKGRDFHAELSAIEQKLENGDIGMSESLRLVSEITRQQTLADAAQMYQQYDQQKETNSAQTAFLKEHPDFNEALASPDFQAIKVSSPLHDNFSAYFAWKHDRDTKALAAGRDAAVAEAYEKGKSEVAKLAQGATIADTVISKPGASMRDQNVKQTLDQRELKQSMLAALDKVRGGR
jgi:hypothetical protein